MEVRLCHLHAVCMSVNPPSLPEPVFMKCGMYIMAFEPISPACSVNLSHQSVCLWCIPPFVDSQRLGKHFLVAKNASKNIRIVGRVFLLVCLCNPLSLLRKSLVKTFPRQRKISGSFVSCMGLVVTKERRRLALPRTSYFFTLKQ
jgi:hypothetical protein